MSHDSPPFFHLQPLTRRPYWPVWQAMQDFTRNRLAETPDEIWLIEHEPVYTIGQAGKKAHIIAPGDIPIIQTDRGGQVTYHGPGQLVVYCLLNLRRLGYTIRALVSALENIVIQLLADYGVVARAKREAPGVYVQDAKIASVGLRIRQGYCYHGLALNVAMDLSPFAGINPCGFSDLAVTQLADLVGSANLSKVASQLMSHWHHGLALN